MKGIKTKSRYCGWKPWVPWSFPRTFPRCIRNPAGFSLCSPLRTSLYFSLFSLPICYSIVFLMYLNSTLLWHAPRVFIASLLFPVGFFIRCSVPISQPRAPPGFLVGSLLRSLCFPGAFPVCSILHFSFIYCGFPNVFSCPILRPFIVGIV